MNTWAILPRPLYCWQSFVGCSISGAMDNAPILDENLNVVCPHCGGYCNFVETEGHNEPSGLYDVPPNYVVDKWVYSCRECGATLKSDIEL